MLRVSADGVIVSVVAQCGGCRCKLAVPHDMAMLSYLSMFTCAARWHMVGLGYAIRLRVGLHAFATQ